MNDTRHAVVATVPAWGLARNAPIHSRDAPGTILDTNMPDELMKRHRANSGVYGQIQYAVFPRVALTIGARGYHSRYGGTVKPRLGVVAGPINRSTLKPLHGTVFLTPSPPRISGRSPHPNTREFTGAPRSSRRLGFSLRRWSLATP